MSVGRQQRFSKAHPCPICGGYDRLPRGIGQRCHGFLSENGRFAHCTREEFAGRLVRNPKSRAFLHKLRGACECGQRHGAATAQPSGKSAGSISERTRERLVGTWDYCDAGNSQTLLQVRRFETGGGKTYRVRRPAPAGWHSCQHHEQCRKDKTSCAGGWIGTLKTRPCSPAVVPVLFNLPLLKSAAPGGLVCVAEGEKSAQVLVDLSFIATTNPFGAGSWRPRYSDRLAALAAALFADADGPGRDHVQQVAKSLWRKAMSIKIVDLYPNRADGSDVVDWVAEHRAAGQADDAIRAELEALIAHAPEWQSAGQSESSSSSSPRESDGDEEHIPRIAPVDLAGLPEPGPREWVWEGRIPARRPTALYGDSGLAKSYFGQLVANHMVRGAPLFGGAVKHGSVLYVDFELDVEEQARRAYEVARGLGLAAPPPGIFYLQPDRPLTRITDEHRGFVRAKGVVLVIVDSFGLAAAGDSTTARDVIPVLTGLNSLPCASLVIDHCRNPHLGETAADLPPFGSVYKRHLSRSVLQVVKAGEDDASLSVIIRPTKANFAALAPPVAIRVVFADHRVTFEQIDAAAATSVALAHSISATDRVLQALAACPDASPQELAEATGLEVGTVRNKLSYLRQQHKASPIRRGRWQATDTSSSSSLPLGDDDDDEAIQGARPERGRRR